MFAPNQQRCSRVLNPLALLFLPLLPWNSRCHFATVAAAQIPDLPWDLTPFPHRAEGCAQQSPPAIRQANSPACVCCPSVLHAAHSGSMNSIKGRLNRLQRIVSLWFLGITGFCVFVLNTTTSPYCGGCWVFCFLKICEFPNVCQWLFTPIVYVISNKLVNSFPVFVFFS